MQRSKFQYLGLQNFAFVFLISTYNVIHFDVQAVNNIIVFYFTIKKRFISLFLMHEENVPTSCYMESATPKTNRLKRIQTQLKLFLTKTQKRLFI